MSKSTHLPALAGTIAGLLAAAFGAWYLYPQHIGPGNGPGNAAARPAPSSTVPSSPHAATSSMQKQILNRDQAVARLMALPELQAWARHIESASRGAVHGAVIPFDPALRTVNGRQYHQLSFIENRPDATVTWESFLVGAADGEILVDEDETLLPLERWRAEKQPMERAGR